MTITKWILLFLVIIGLSVVVALFDFLIDSNDFFPVALLLSIALAYSLWDLWHTATTGKRGKKDRSTDNTKSPDN